MKLKSIKWDGAQITKPGMYSHIPMSLYHKWDICVGPSISSSGLRTINPDIGSPKHFRFKVKEETEKRHFVIGRALHHLALGEKFFAAEYCAQPDEYPEKKTGLLKKWNYNAGFCTEWREARRKEGREPLSPSEVVMIREMAIAVGNHPLVKEGLFTGLVERSFFWKDKETGIWLKWRPDVVPTASADYGDLKTTQSTHGAAISNSIRSFGYYQQAALGRWATREVLGMDMASYTYLFVEKQSPWCTRDIRIPDEDLNRGERMNRACLRTYARCLKEKRWPGPGEGHEGTENIGLGPSARESIDKTLQYAGLADGQD